MVRQELKRRMNRMLGRRGGRCSWSVCAMVDEPTELLLAMAAHYLEQGADEVHLFLDNPDPAQIEALSQLKGLRLTACDAGFWKRLRIARPPKQIMRQRRIANFAYASCASDWFFFCDADEFLLPEGPVGETLAQLPPEVIHARPHMSERAFVAGTPQTSLYDGVWRRPIHNKERLRRVYGDLAPMTTFGLLGHVLSKSFVRTGQKDLTIRIHFPVPKDPEEEERLRAAKQLRPGPFIDGLWLVHFDGLTPLHWQLKMIRYFLQHAALEKDGARPSFNGRTAARKFQLNAMYDARGDAEALARVISLMRLTPEMLERLRAAGGLLELPLDPVASARRRGLPDLSFGPEAFDAALLARHGDLVRDFGLLQSSAAGW